MYLVAEIGGTKSLLGVFEHGGDPTLHETRRCATSEHGSLEEMLLDFLRGRPVDGAIVAIASAVIDGAAAGTNLPWAADERSLASALGAPVRLINDLEAIAAAIPALEPQHRIPLLEGTEERGGPIGVIAPGTGMGTGYLVCCGDGYRAMPSEGGHVDFAPTNELQLDLLEHLMRSHEHVSLERACSGGGLPMLYRFMVETGRAVPQPEQSAMIEAAADPTPLIVDAALRHRCEACARALETFVEILGAAAGNLALTLVATGGVYLGGGIAPRILEALRQPGFERGFRSKGRLSYVPERIPVWVIADPDCGLLGAARCTDKLRDPR